MKWKIMLALLVLLMMTGGALSESIQTGSEPFYNQLVEQGSPHIGEGTNNIDEPAILENTGDLAPTTYPLTVWHLNWNEGNISDTGINVFNISEDLSTINHYGGDINPDYQNTHPTMPAEYSDNPVGELDVTKSADRSKYYIVHTMGANSTLKFGSIAFSTADSPNNFTFQCTLLSVPDGALGGYGNPQLYWENNGTLYLTIEHAGAENNLLYKINDFETCNVTHIGNFSAPYRHGGQDIERVTGDRYYATYTDTNRYLAREYSNVADGLLSGWTLENTNSTYSYYLNRDMFPYNGTWYDVQAISLGAGDTDLYWWLANYSTTLNRWFELSSQQKTWMTNMLDNYSQTYIYRNTTTGDDFVEVRENNTIFHIYDSNYNFTNYPEFHRHTNYKGWNDFAWVDTNGFPTSQTYDAKIKINRTQSTWYKCDGTYSNPSCNVEIPQGKQTKPYYIEEGDETTFYLDNFSGVAGTSEAGYDFYRNITNSTPSGLMEPVNATNGGWSDIDGNGTQELIYGERVDDSVQLRYNDENDTAIKNDTQTFYKAQMYPVNETSGTPPSDLAGWWTFDRQDSTLWDYSGNNNDGSLAGSIAQGAPGMVGYSYDWDNTDDEIEVPYNSSLDVHESGGFTIFARVYYGSGELNDCDFIVMKKTSAGVADDQLEYGLVVGDGACYGTSNLGEVSFTWGDGASRYDHTTGTDVVQEGQWTDIVATYSLETDEWNIYFNGNLVGNGTETNSPVVNNYELNIGVHYDVNANPDTWANCSIGEIMILNKSVTQQTASEWSNSSRNTLLGAEAVCGYTSGDWIVSSTLECNQDVQVDAGSILKIESGGYLYGSATITTDKRYLWDDGRCDVDRIIYR